MKTKIPANRLTIIFRDDAPLIHCGDSPSYRRVTIDLTEEQRNQIKVNATCTSMGKDIFESVSKCFFEYKK